jgi:hypothetical protein
MGLRKAAVEKQTVMLLINLKSMIEELTFKVKQ